MQYTIHPFAEFFSDLPEKEFEAFVEDIRTNGQQVPIVLYYRDKSILDGRQRYKACLKLGIEPKTIMSTAFDDDAVMTEIISLNIKRRTNSLEERTLAADNWANYTQGGARNFKRSRERLNNEDSILQTQEDAAKLFNTSIGSIKRMRLIREHAPAYLAKVLDANDETTLTYAGKIAQQNKATKEAQEKFIAEQRAREAAEAAARDREAAEDLLREAQESSNNANASDIDAAAEQMREAMALAMAAAAAEAQRRREAEAAAKESERASESVKAKAEQRAEAERKMKEKQEAKLKPKVKTKAKPEVKPLKSVFLTREQVDPEFKGSDLEFTKMYGHVLMKTAEQRARERFGLWTIHIDHLYSIDVKNTEEWVDLNWLRSPKPSDVKRMRKAIDQLKPLLQKAEEMLIVAERAVANQKPVENNDEPQPEMDPLQNTQA